ncbi:MAG: hypothetical protein Q4F69_10705 [Bacteroidia bacterium]|nr:hypothetical protein [Bacteroidia bacterium]
MNYYKVAVSKNVFTEIEEIADFIIKISTPEHAIKYKNQLISEIAALSYMADVINYSQWKVAKRCHPKAKRMITKNKKWNVIFHVEGFYVIVDKIIPTKMVNG